MKKASCSILRDRRKHRNGKSSLILSCMMFVPFGTSVMAAEDPFASLPPLPQKVQQSQEVGQKVILRKAGFEEHVRKFVLPEGMQIQVRERLQLQTAKVQRDMICANWVVVSSSDQVKLRAAKTVLAASFPGLRLQQNGKGLFLVHAPTGQDPVEFMTQIKIVLPIGVEIQTDGVLFLQEPKLDKAKPPQLPKLPQAPKGPQRQTAKLTGPIGAALPNDASTDANWWIYRTGADRAWDITTGSRSVIVAVVDFGFNVNSSDLRNNYWTNPLEIPNNGIDDDGNGQIDDIKGWNFSTGQKDLTNSNNHGQHVAGIIGAEGNNGLYQCGMNWQVSILPLQIQTWSQVADAFHYTAKMKREHGHNIVAVNASLGGGAAVDFVKEAIRDMESAELLLVAAAGNYTGNEAIYPAWWSSELSNVLSVGAIEANGARSGFSNYSTTRTTVDVAAPGTALEEGLTKTGTSMATPMVAGAIGLLASLRPGLKAVDYRNIINQSSRPNAGWAGFSRTGGELDVPSAIARLQSQYSTNTPPTLSVATSVTTNEDVASSPIAITMGDAQTAVTALTLTVVSSNTALIPNQNLVLGGSGANRTLVISPAANQNGAATITVTVSDGSLSTSTNITVTVNPVNDKPNCALSTNAVTFVAPASITMTANANDIDGSVAKVEFYQGTTLLGSDTSSPYSFTWNNVPVGSYTVTAKAIDNGGESCISNSLNISVEAAATEGPSGYTWCANEGGSYTFTQIVDVAYGANGVYAYQYGVTGTIAFHNGTFGDPIGGVLKKGYYRVASGGNTAPTISTISNVTINEDSSSAAIPFTIADAQSAATALTVTAQSSNSNIAATLGGSGANRTVTVAPVTNYNGTANIVVTVSDGSLSASSTFAVIVNPVNDAPVNTVLPAITGIAQVGQTLNASTGTWNDTIDNGNIVGYVYQWIRANDAAGSGSVEIASANAASYTTVAADLGKFLRVKVTATDNGGASAQAISAWTAAVIAAGGGSNGASAIAYVNTLSNTAGWRSSSVAKPAGTDPNGDGALGSDGYWLQADSVLSSLPSYIGTMTIPGYADGNPVVSLDNPSLSIGATVNDVGGRVVRINNPVAGQYYTMLSFTVTQDQTFTLTVITDTYGQAAGRNPESIRVQRDNGTKYDNVISDLGVTQGAPSPNLTPDFVIFTITAKAGDVINVMGMKTTTDTRIGIGGVAFELIPPSSNG